MDLMDLKQEAERSKHDFWLFLIEQSLHDPQIDIFTQYGQFCDQVDQVTARTEQAFTELDTAAEETRAKMAALLNMPERTLSPRMEEEFDGMTPEQIEELLRRCGEDGSPTAETSVTDDEQQ
jgi:hypothetical protein